MEASRIEDPPLRQRYAFSRDGEKLRIETWTDPGGGFVPEHVHLVLDEL
jgi:hypothetical protein